LPNQMIDMIIAIRDHEGGHLVGGDQDLTLNPEPAPDHPRLLNS